MAEIPTPEEWAKLERYAFVAMQQIINNGYWGA
jgi:hypothetical protein